MTDYKDGDTITVNGKPCRIEGSALVPVVQRGPLGGELKKLGYCIENEIVAYLGKAIDINRGIGAPALVEVNIPPRPTFTPMTAGEAAKLPDIVGRWVAVQVDRIDRADNSLCCQESWFASVDKILLIEGVDL